MLFIENNAARLLSASIYKPLGAGLTTKVLTLMPGMNEIKEEDWEEMYKVNGKVNPTLAKWMKSGWVKMHKEKPEPEAPAPEAPKKKNRMVEAPLEESTKSHIVML